MMIQRKEGLNPGYLKVQLEQYLNSDQLPEPLPASDMHTLFQKYLEGSRNIRRITAAFNLELAAQFRSDPI
jgi:hypothetical protein